MNFENIPILATAISIVICWGLFAIFCSMVQECMAQLKAERGRFMKEYMLQQLQDIPNGINWALLLYNHGAVDLLSRAPEKPTNEIPAHLFAETLVDVVGQAHAVQINAEEMAAAVPYKHATLRNFKIAIMVLKPSDVMTFLNQALKSAELAAPKTDGAADESMLYKTLVDNLERWHDTFSERLTLWYKKRVRQRLFFLGIILALVLNIDSVQLFQVFNSSPAARKGMTTYYQQNSKRYEALATNLDSLQKKRANGNADSLKGSITNLKRSVDSLKDMAVTMSALGQSLDLPIGTQYNMFSTWHKLATPLFVLLKIVGVLISGFAASFGAPFWFDLLKKAFAAKP